MSGKDTRQTAVRFKDIRATIKVYGSFSAFWSSVRFFISHIKASQSKNNEGERKKKSFETDYIAVCVFAEGAAVDRSWTANFQ